MSVAKKGEMCNRELLNPKYRFMMETRRRRAAERDAAAAAVAAKAAEIDALKREHARVRQEWEEKDKARRGANAKTRKEHRKASQRLAASQTRERQHREAVELRRRRAGMQTFRRAEDHGRPLQVEKLRREQERTLFHLAAATCAIVDGDGARRGAARGLGISQQRYYVGAAADREFMRSRATSRASRPASIKRRDAVKRWRRGAGLNVPSTCRRRSGPDRSSASRPRLVSTEYPRRSRGGVESWAHTSQ